MTNLGVSLWITLIGMGLVFGVILLLWGLLALLVPLGRRFANLRAAHTEALPVPQELDEMNLAAAVALVAAMAATETEQLPLLPLPPTAVVTPWQALTRAKILNTRGPVR